MSTLLFSLPGRGICAMVLLMILWHMGSAQNVGIGHTTPVAKLDIRGVTSLPSIPGATSTGVVRIGVSSVEGIDIGKISSAPFTAWIQVGYNGTDTDPLCLQPLGGNVGIGTATPAAKLEVAGDVKVNGKISNVTDPVAAQDAATKNYVDQMAEILLDAGLNGVVMDIDGNVYKTIKIDTQVWMAQNLRTTRYNDGAVIPKVTDNMAWYDLTTPAYCWYSNDSTLNAKIYGALYNYYTVAETNSLNVCPTGWHIPSDAEWTVLSAFLIAYGYGYGGSGTDIGKSMASTFRWMANGSSGAVGNDPGTNNSCGFAGLPGGVRNNNGTFNDIGNYGGWWSFTENNSSFAWYRYLSYFSDYLHRDSYDKRLGFSVRCLRD